MSSAESGMAKKKGEEGIEGVKDDGKKGGDGKGEEKGKKESNKRGVPDEPADAAVLAYLRKRGLGNAAMELARALKEEKKARKGREGEDGKEGEDDNLRVEQEEMRARHQRTALSLSTGGGIGYDLDASPSVAIWGCFARSAEDDLVLQQKQASKRARKNALQIAGESDADAPNKPLTEEQRRGREEAMRYVESFTALQTWVLSLPDESPSLSSSNENKSSSKLRSLLHHARKQQTPDWGKLQPSSDADHDDDTDPPEASDDSLYLTSTGHALPQNTKPELLTVTFPLLVHTYCELLECGLESTAASLLATYRHVHEPLYATELSDLDRCTTTQQIIELNLNVLANTDAISDVRSIKSQVHQFKKKKRDLLNTHTMPDDANKNDASSDAQQKRRIAEAEENLARLEAKLAKANQAAAACSRKLQSLPFLRRARALRWQISLSASSYGLLAARLSSDEVLLPMSALLQCRCHIHVEGRDPLPFAPPSLLSDPHSPETTRSQMQPIRWAAPLHPSSRAAESGRDASSHSHPTSSSILTAAEELPFPKFYLDREYGTEEEATADTRIVQFNRALLVNGYRRLEALELKREYEVGTRKSANTAGQTTREAGDNIGNHQTDGDASTANPFRPSILFATLCSSSNGTAGAAAFANATVGGRGGISHTPSPWEESGIGITCAKLCPPDGRQVATGGDDAAVRIWKVGGDYGGGGGTSWDEEEHYTTASSIPNESSLVLLGHKNGFPVFDLDWNRDGRTLLSAGGDGTVRLWDTAAVGPYGRLANVKTKTPQHAGGLSSSNISQSTGNASTAANRATSKISSSPGVDVPGAKSEPMVEVSGAALSVYHGHTPSTPIWSVTFAPSGYYFASAGSDSTGRIWSTDHPTPIRILSGHFSSVNSISWHPNCNYVVTGSDDKTARMFDVQTGRCVRLLSGCRMGVNVVRVSPSGRYAAGADYSGTVNIWDLGTGRKVNELKPSPHIKAGISDSADAAIGSASMVHAMSYSACGTVLATGGDDCTVRVWDVRGAGSHLSNEEYAASQGWGRPGGGAAGGVLTSSQMERRPTMERSKPGTRVPVGTFQTRRTMVLDLKYTKRNLLLGVGSYAVSAPIQPTTVAD